MPEFPRLRGRRLVTAAFDAACDEWVFSFTGPCVLRVAAPWRVVSNGEIVAGHADEGQSFGLGHPIDVGERVLSTIAGHEISEATFTAFGDLTLSFGAGSQVQVFNSSAGYEGWQLSRPGEPTVVAQGGGGVVGPGD